MRVVCVASSSRGGSTSVRVGCGLKTLTSTLGGVTFHRSSSCGGNGQQLLPSRLFHAYGITSADRTFVPCYFSFVIISDSWHLHKLLSYSFFFFLARINFCFSTSESHM